jgi:hypothetical protein
MAAPAPFTGWRSGPVLHRFAYVTFAARIRVAVLPRFAYVTFAARIRVAVLPRFAYVTFAARIRVRRAAWSPCGVVAVRRGRGRPSWRR